MSETKIDVADRERLSWPPFCVRCLKPEPKESMELAFGDAQLQVPYCGECYQKVLRQHQWLWERPAQITAALGGFCGFVVATLYLGNAVYKEGVLGLLDSWKMTVVLFWVVLGIVFLILSFLSAIFGSIPYRLVSVIAPDRFAKPGVEVSQTGMREIVTQPTPGTEIKTEKSFIKELRFTNPQYAEKFRVANELKKEVSREEIKE